MMRSASRQAVRALAARRAELVGAGAPADVLSGLADELHAVATLLAAQPQLRRTLADPATDPNVRGGLVADLLAGKVSDTALQTVRTAVQARWSSPWDLVDALDDAADDTLLQAAESQGAATEVEDQLFRFQRTLDEAGELTVLLDEESVEPDRRAGLLGTVLSGKVHPITMQLLDHAVRSDRKRSIHAAIDRLLDAAATRREQSRARVTSAVELTEAQHSRLAATLAGLYGRPISVLTAVDPDVRGGLVVRVGDEVIDGSVASRLLQARAALA